MALTEFDDPLRRREDDELSDLSGYFREVSQPVEQPSPVARAMQTIAARREQERLDPEGTLAGLPRDRGDRELAVTGTVTDRAGLGGTGATGDEFETAIRNLAAYLNQPLFTESDEARRRAMRFDNLERQRQAARQQVIERLAAQGHAQSSGTVEQALQMVDQRFDAFRTQGEAELQQEALDVGERRKKEALQTLLLIPRMRMEQERIRRSGGGDGGSDFMEGLGTLLGFFL